MLSTTNKSFPTSGPLLGHKRHHLDYDSNLDINTQTCHHFSPSSSPLPSLINSIWGLGALSIPYAVMRNGLLLGTTLLLVIPAVLSWSLLLLVRCARLSHAQDYGQLMEDCFGNLGRLTWMGAHIIFVVGSLAAYLMILTDNLNAFLKEWSAIPVNDIVFWLIIILIILPLCWEYHKWETMLRKVELLPLLSAILTTLAVSSSPRSNLQSPIISTLFGDRQGFLEGLGLISFTFVVHPEVFDLLNTFSKRKDQFQSAIFRGTTICAISSVLLAIGAAYKHGGDIDVNILNNCQGAPYLLTAIAQLTTTLAMIVTFPFDFVVVQEQFLSTDYNTCSSRRKLWSTLILMGVPILVARGVGQLDVILEVTGGLATSALALIFPALCYLKLSSEYNVLPINGKGDGSAQTLCYLLVAFGITLFFSSSYLAYNKIF